MQLIEFSDGNSGVTGYNTSLEEENFFNYLNEHLEQDVIDELISWMKQKNVYEFSVLKNIWVDESDRGQGIGKQLLENFFQECGGNPIILICDNLETQKKGFVLEQWYESYGFEATGFVTLSGPILIRY